MIACFLFISVLVFNIPFQDSMYKCHYCLGNAENLSTAVNHCIEQHANHELVIGMLALSTGTGKLGYMAKHYGVVPSELHSANSTAC